MISNMLQQTLILSLFAGTLASPLLGARQSCSSIHIFGARETTASPGYGSAGTVVTEILNAHPGSSAEAINYPASGSNPSYSESVKEGTAAVVSQVSSYAKRCPTSKLVLVGYSQGGEIFDNALCGGGDPNQGISSTGSIASYNVVAAIFMGDPRYKYGAPYDVGTCRAGGFDARPAGQYCGSYNSKMQSYCDASDPYCCNGNNAATHQGYGSEYGSQALAFINSKL